LHADEGELWRLWMSRAVYVLSLFCAALGLVVLAYASIEPVGANVEYCVGEPRIDVDRTGFALAWRVTAGGRLMCQSPYINQATRTIECD
jgi:hypothetical protein